MSHAAYGCAAQLCELDEDGKLKRMAAAHGVVMSIGFALTEQYPVADCKPTAPAISEAYCQFDKKRRYVLPLEGTPYSRKE